MIATSLIYKKKKGGGGGNVHIWVWLLWIFFALLTMQTSIKHHFKECGKENSLIKTLFMKCLKFVFTSPLQETWMQISKILMTSTDKTARISLQWPHAVASVSRIRFILLGFNYTLPLVCTVYLRGIAIFQSQFNKFFRNNYWHWKCEGSLSFLIRPLARPRWFHEACYLMLYSVFRYCHMMCQRWPVAFTGI